MAHSHILRVCFQSRHTDFFCFPIFAFIRPVAALLFFLLVLGLVLVLAPVSDGCSLRLTVLLSLVEHVRFLVPPAQVLALLLA